MGKEIERKFLVCGNHWKKKTEGIFYRQGYLALTPECCIRVRVSNEIAYLTVKSQTVGITRQEFEYVIPNDEAEKMLQTLCIKPLIEKIRYIIKEKEMVWEIDEFQGENLGLILAEIELEREDQQIEIPPWVSKEVSQDPRFFNSSLVKFPYTKWVR